MASRPSILSSRAERTRLDRSTLLATAALAAIAALSVLLRLPFVSVPLNTDEGGYAYTAHWMMRGLALYRDLWFDRPQGTFLLYAAIQRLFGESAEAIRIGAAVYNAATVVLSAALGGRLFGRRAGIAAALLLAFASASPVVEGFTANGELLMNLPIVGALLLAVSGRWGLAGFVTALAMAVKPTALASLGPPLVTLAFLWPSDAAASEASIGLRRLAWTAAGGLVGAVPFVAHGAATNLAGYWYAVVGFRVAAHSAFAVGQAVVDDFLGTAPTVLAALLPLWLLAALALQRRGLPVARPPSLITHHSSLITSSALLVGSIAGAAAGGYWYWHYYVGLLPGACLLAGVGLDHLTATRSNRLAMSTFALSVLVAAFANARVVGATPGETSLNLYGRRAYLASAEIARYVRRHTSDHDRIYAAFAQADLAHLAGRLSAGKQLYWTEINRIPGALEDILEALDDPARRPVYVIEVQDDLETPGRAAQFWRRVAQLYRLETTIQGFKVFRLRGEEPGGEPGEEDGGEQAS